MSSEIIYDKQFIKVSNTEYVPFVLGGSSNCTQMSSKGREIRARSWFSLNVGVNKKYFFTLEEMISECEQYRARLIASNEKDKARHLADESTYYSEYTDKAFGWHTSLCIGSYGAKTTYGMYKGLFTTGAKNALTVEELAEYGFHIDVHSYSYDTDKLKASGLEELREYPKTSAELRALLVDVVPKYLEAGVSVYIGGDIHENDRFWMKKKLHQAKPKSLKPKKEYTEMFVFRLVDLGSYIVRIGSRSIKHTYYLSNSVTRRYTLVEAERKLKQLQARTTKSIVIEKIALDIPVMA